MTLGQGLFPLGHIEFGGIPTAHAQGVDGVNGLVATHKERQEGFFFFVSWLLCVAVCCCVLLFVVVVSK